MKDESAGGLKSRLSAPVRVFGRAVTWVGTGAKTVVRSPFRAAQARRLQASGPTPELVFEPAAGSELSLQTLTNDCKEAVLLTQQKLSSQLQDSADFLRQRIPFSQQSNCGFMAANCFPPRLVARPSQGLGGEEAQDLVSVGSREMLRIKLYDFAVYRDRRQVRQSQLSKRFGSKARQKFQDGESELALTHGIRDSSDLDMSLVVRAARNLPIRLLAKEYERILRRRLRVVGGSPHDPALHKMLQHFREEVLPEEIKQGASVRKGTVITFARDSQGNINARTNGQDLVSVNSSHLGQAVFDIYLGNQVVSNKARRDAGSSFIKMLGEEDFQPPQDQLVCSEQACRVGRLY